MVNLGTNNLSALVSTMAYVGSPLNLTSGSVAHHGAAMIGGLGTSFSAVNPAFSYMQGLIARSMNYGSLGLNRFMAGNQIATPAQMGANRSFFVTRRDVGPAPSGGVIDINIDDNEESAPSRSDRAAGAEEDTATPEEADVVVDSDDVEPDEEPEVVADTTDDAATPEPAEPAPPVEPAPPPPPAPEPVEPPPPPPVPVRSPPAPPPVTPSPARPVTSPPVPPTPPRSEPLVDHSAQARTYLNGLTTSGISVTDDNRITCSEPRVLQRLLSPGGEFSEQFGEALVQLGANARFERSLLTGDAAARLQTVRGIVDRRVASLDQQDATREREEARTAEARRLREEREATEARAAEQRRTRVEAARRAVAERETAAARAAEEARQVREAEQARQQAIRQRQARVGRVASAIGPRHVRASHTPEHSSLTFRTDSNPADVLRAVQANQSAIAELPDTQLRYGTEVMENVGALVTRLQRAEREAASAGAAAEARQAREAAQAARSARIRTVDSRVSAANSAIASIRGSGVTIRAEHGAADSEHSTVAITTSGDNPVLALAALRAARPQLSRLPADTAYTLNGAPVSGGLSAIIENVEADVREARREEARSSGIVAALDQAVDDDDEDASNRDLRAALARAGHGVLARGVGGDGAAGDVLRGGRVDQAEADEALRQARVHAAGRGRGDSGSGIADGRDHAPARPARVGSHHPDVTPRPPRDVQPSSRPNPGIPQVTVGRPSGGQPNPDDGDLGRRVDAAPTRGASADQWLSHIFGAAYRGVESGHHEVRIPRDEAGRILWDEDTFGRQLRDLLPSLERGSEIHFVWPGHADQTLVIRGDDRASLDDRVNRVLGWVREVAGQTPTADGAPAMDFTALERFVSQEIFRGTPGIEFVQDGDRLIIRCNPRSDPRTTGALQRITSMLPALQELRVTGRLNRERGRGAPLAAEFVEALAAFPHPIVVEVGGEIIDPHSGRGAPLIIAQAFQRAAQQAR
ncbi:MAG: hypothetical protein ABH859_02355 [Pseudomonadota bacterium]